MGQNMSEIGQRTIAHQVEEYIETHPIVRNALQKGIVNYSSLARLIQEKLGTKTNFEAFLIAVRRNAHALSKIKEHIESKVQKVLEDSNFEVKTKLAVLTLENFPETMEKLGEIIKQLSYEHIYFQIIQGSSAITFIVEQKYLDKLSRLEKNILRTKKNTIGIIIKSSPKIEDVPGVVSFIMNAFAERNINVLENLSCYTDTIIIIDPKDMCDAVKLLDKLL